MRLEMKDGLAKTLSEAHEELSKVANQKADLAVLTDKEKELFAYIAKL